MKICDRCQGHPVRAILLHAGADDVDCVAKEQFDLCQSCEDEFSEQMEGFVESFLIQGRGDTSNK